MRFFLRSLPFLLTASLAPHISAAADAKHSYVILGPGAYSCERIISDLKRDKEAGSPASQTLYSTWLAGNLTAYNRETRGTYSILGDTSFTDAFGWALGYCAEFPDRIFASAADALVLKLKPERYTTMPKPEDKEDKDDDNDDDDKGDK